MSYSLSPLPGQSDFGVVVTGFKPEMIDDPKIRKALYDLWIDKGVVVFKELAGLDTHLKLSEVFGENQEHPLLRGLDMPREKKVSITIDEVGGGVYEVHGEELSGWLAWHKDSIYTDQLNHGGILWSLTVPERGGQTGFIDQIAAYDALPDNLKARIEGLNVIYAYTRDSWESKFGDKPDRRIRLSDFQSKTMSTRPVAGDPPDGLCPGTDRAQGDQRLTLVRRRHRGDGEFRGRRPAARSHRAHHAARARLFPQMGAGRDGAVGQLAALALRYRHAGRHAPRDAPHDHPWRLQARPQGKARRRRLKLPIPQHFLHE